MIRKKITRVLLLILIFIVLVWLRCYFSSMSAFNRGESYLASKNYIQAITYFDRSIHWYTPLNPYIKNSAEQLWKIGENALEDGDQRLALIAFRTIRSGFYSSGNVFQPGKEWIEKCDEKIKDILKKEIQTKTVAGDPSKWDGKVPKGQTFDSPDVLWSIILEIGFIGWIGMTIGIILYLKKGSLVRRSGIIKRFILLAAFFSMWVTGLITA